MVESEQLAEDGNLEENLAQEVETKLNVENQQSLNSEVAEISNEAYDSVTRSGIRIRGQQAKFGFCRVKAKSKAP
ncbi:hypothetical protein VIGAN_02211300 [Vigna angularis var. angularis]|uniref:Uncharacterized protein n=1 Tax=Vigna angularis var. angularis TaxID=157739 RepID=A0A0S3RFI5_PHAAN|nr:hypothetical protein VIGAN_02211300 [Vigna angularis var. angularis]